MANSITVDVPDGAFSAYIARPSAQSAPALVVIQEIFGVNAVMRGICDDLAAKGYLALCPDLFWRIEPGIDITNKSKAEWDRAFELYQAFDVDKGVSDIAATIVAGKTATGSSGAIGAVGFCLGGLLAYLTAARTEAAACVCFYGVGIDKHLDESTHGKPVMLHIADEDQFVPPPARETIIGVLSGREGVTIHTYPGCNHAFAREGGDHYDAPAAKLAWKRTLDFFGETL